MQSPPYSYIILIEVAIRICPVTGHHYIHAVYRLSLFRHSEVRLFGLACTEYILSFYDLNTVITIDRYTQHFQGNCDYYYTFFLSIIRHAYM